MNCPQCSSTLTLTETLPAAKSTRRRYTCTCGFANTTRECIETREKWIRVQDMKKYFRRMKLERPEEYQAYRKRQNIRRFAREEALRTGEPVEEIFVRWGVPTRERGKR